MICCRYTNFAKGRLKLSLSHIWIPRSSTDDFVAWLSTWKFVFVSLSEFTIILIIFNHFIAIFLSVSNLLYQIRKCVCPSRNCIIISEIMNWGRLNEKNWSLIEKLNRSGPTIEPCGTPEMIFSKLLYVLFIRIHCFRFFK